MASLGPISEGMQVMTADGQLVGLVRAVWGGLADLGSTLEMERATGVGADIESDPEVSDLPEGTTPIGETAPGYLEVQALEDEGTLYVPLSDVADVTGDHVVLQRTLEEVGQGLYSRDPSAR
ncbi:MAG: DUF2171 domain-containing protein [Chloroflexota bacterium]|nr:DUF2171 domain-containing protein [Chloroflexota bacterium]